MSTHLTLLAVGISTLLIGTAVVGMGWADQVVGPGTVNLLPTGALWSGTGSPVLLTGMSGYGGSFHGKFLRTGPHVWGGPYWGGSYLWAPDSGYGTPVNQNSCVWNGYKFTCYDPKGNAL
jgi:hypothetical protein